MDIEETGKVAGKIFEFIGENGIRYEDALEVLEKNFWSVELGWWKPEVSHPYHFIDDHGNIDTCVWSDDKIDMWRYSQRNVFQTEKQAQFKKDKDSAYSELIDLIEKINLREGWVADFGDFGQEKEYIVYNHQANEIRFNVEEMTQSRTIEEYFKRGSYQEIVETLGEDKIKLALGIAKND